MSIIVLINLGAYQVCCNRMLAETPHSRVTEKEAL